MIHAQRRCVSNTSEVVPSGQDGGSLEGLSGGSLPCLCATFSVSRERTLVPGAVVGGGGLPLVPTNPQGLHRPSPSIRTHSQVKYYC